MVVFNKNSFVFSGVAIILVVVYICYVKITSSENFKKYERMNYVEALTANPSDSQFTIDTLNIAHLPIEINAVNNFSTYESKFYIPNDTSIVVNGTAEAADYFSDPYLFKSYDNDGVEIYFDMKNEKSIYFDANKDDRQYRVLWKSLKIDGQNTNKEGVKVLESDPSLNTYIMQITFPWKTLGYMKPIVGAKLGFDIALIDSDGGTMKSELNWHSKSEDAWKNTSYYGTMILAYKNYKTDSNYVLALKRNKTFGKQRALNYKFKYVTIGYVVDSLDLSGTFQAEWDVSNLYIKVFVRDNFKSVAQAIFDYGWIEDSKGNNIWKMDLVHLKYAGGALKNKKVNTVIRLKKGFYYLKYHTDESHSPSKWDALPPKTSFYGIKLSYE